MKIMLEVNKIYCEDNLVTMGNMPDGFLDLTVTSPPYDNLRDYNGFSFDFENVAKELFRVTKEGGVVVWVVADASVNGSETLSSFRQILYFREIGFNIWDTMIWEKESFRNPLHKRYHPVFEFMFIISKGSPKTFNGIKDRKNLFSGNKIHGTQRLKNGTTRDCHSNGDQIMNYGLRHNVWRINSDRQNLGHPAPFPEKLAADHISTWSNESDLVYDPFCGSGTVPVVSNVLKRNWIASEISKEYCDIAEKRIAPYLQQTKMF